MNFIEKENNDTFTLYISGQAFMIKKEDLILYIYDDNLWLRWFVAKHIDEKYLPLMIKNNDKMVLEVVKKRLEE